MEINLPKKYALMPIFDCDKIIGDLVVKNIRVVGYAVSRCYLVDGEPTITPVDEIFEDYMSAREVCDLKNKEVFEEEYDKKKTKDRYKFEKNFNRKTDYVTRYSVNKLVLERK